MTLGWSGSLSTSPYLHLLDDVLQTLQQHHEVDIRVIGNPDFRISGVKIDAQPWQSRTEVADLLAIDIGLYPLRKQEWDLGKSGLKALQYMGLGIPTVLTPFGANLEIVTQGENGRHTLRRAVLVRSRTQDRSALGTCSPRWWTSISLWALAIRSCA